MRTLAHISDLHFGAADPQLVTALGEALRTLRPDVIALSGDLTQRARRAQFRAAREFLDTLPFPTVVVPGNHDVPLYNVLLRFGDPLRGYHRFISTDRYPVHVDDELTVIGADTTRSFTIKDGGLRRRDVRHLVGVLSQSPESVKVVVCHHPFDPLRGRSGRVTAPRPDTTAVNTLVAAGVDVFLTGHRHLTYVGHTAIRYQVAGRSAIVVEAGTATSLRARGEANAFNVLRVEADTIVVDRVDWSPSASAFTPAQRERFLCTDDGWVADDER